MSSSSPPSNARTVRAALDRAHDATLEQAYGTVSPRSLGRGILGGLGQTPASLHMVAECLNHNHIHHDIFFDDRASRIGSHFTKPAGLHNHAAHHLLAGFSLGAGASAIAAMYEASLQGFTRPMPESDAQITEANWQEFLGKDKAYPAYLAFFHKIISQFGSATAIERYVFGGEGKMLQRFVSGAIHPFIHTGYGVEFGADALVAEGLAQCAIHSAQAGALFPDPWPPHTEQNGSKTSTPSHASFVETVAMSASRPVTAGTNGFDLLAEMLQDKELAPGVANNIDSNPALGVTLKRKGELIKTYCERWSFSSSLPEWDEVVHKTEELFWLATVIYGAATRPGYQPKLDFFTMHALTSVLFLPSFLEVLGPQYWTTVLHSHFRVMVAYWIARGRPKLFIAEYLMASTDTPCPPSHPSKRQTLEAGALQRAIVERGLSKASTETNGPDGVNPWFAIHSAAIDHPDEHVTKVIRSLSFAAQHFGTRPKGYFESRLPEVDQLDGTAFVRAAGMTLDAMGWAHFGQEPAPDWDRSKPGYDEAWTDAAKL
ncbi:hypothetical protein OIV83_005412 [Microbotryomycetes sp. JL201]|nr:hypothetical protein OIV83_005412 [Microbotryomycetes sp. JL201]